ncbi:hypothetical protein [Polyangium aurulentum]|uniref:hypothetical protein n=1 Tax=Polyangium aurulentum TaxID=2567896 RepID=UPI00146B09A9|nr:hypothetical protein [Polyangium aurulentum]UQA58962.1 hypothetical protein E8A73_000105 [Polyangium aurulentum]
MDAGFGEEGTGISRLSFGADDDGGFFALHLLGNDIIAAGWGQGGLGGSAFRTSRLTAAAGLPVSAFESETVRTTWAASTADYVYASAVGHQSSGRIVVIGHRERFREETANLAMAGYLPGGALDPSFGTSGKKLLDLGGEEVVRGGLVLPDDKILVVGQRDDRLFIARTTPNGDLDPSFASRQGHATVKVGTSSEARAVTLDPEGRILVIGSAQVRGQSDMILLRFTPSGALDRTFGEGGVVMAGDRTADEHAAAIEVWPKNFIVVAGDTGPEGRRDFQVRAFHFDGSPVREFGAAGVATYSNPGGDDHAEDMTLMPGGDVLVVGNAAERGQPLVVRYTCQGSLDGTFGSGGVVRPDLGEDGVLHTVERYSDDRVLLGGGDVGMSPGPGTYGVVARMWM